MDDPVREINQRFCQRRVCMIWKTKHALVKDWLMFCFPKR